MTPLLQTAGWTLIHFIWQGAAIAGGASALLTLTRRRSASVRYVIACASLAAMLAAPLVTARLLWTAGGSQSAVTEHTSVSSTAVAAARGRTDQAAAKGRVTSRDIDEGVAVRQGPSPARPIGFSLATLEHHDRVARRRRHSAGADGRRLVARPAAPSRGARDELVALADAVPPAGVPARAPGGGARGRVRAGRRADCRRLAASGDPAADRRPGIVDALAGRSHPRARARAYPSSRLRRQRAADDRRDAAVLSPRGVVALEACACRTRALLRRHRDRDLRRSGWVRARAG